MLFYLNASSLDLRTITYHYHKHDTQCVMIIMAIYLYQVYTSLGKALENIDSKLLPKEYGGTIPMADMISMYDADIV